MEVKKVEVIRYHACDGTVFSKDIMCLEYEKELRRRLSVEIQDQQIEISKLKIEKNKTRLQFLIKK